MLHSLEIKNYRNLKELRIHSLGRVNLITGKNNTGKSTLLEAVGIYATRGYVNFIYQLLAERGETFEQGSANKSPFETNIKLLSSLFSNRISGFDVADAVLIGSLEKTSHSGLSLEDTVSLRFVKFVEETHIDEQGNRTREPKFIQNDSEAIGGYKIGFGIEAKNYGLTSYGLNVLSLEHEEFKPYLFETMKPDNIDRVQFIRTRSIDRGINGMLFDNIVLTDKEQHVIEALKIIEPLTEKIAFINNASSGERNAVIKLSDSQSKLPLPSMGDGINRILTMILALVSAGNGYLLLDEFENGLHHTAQEKLWEIIFELSAKLNTQVFVTTHSEDCIRGFERVLNHSNSSDGKLIRLDNIDGTIKQVEFDANELKIATDQNIEVR